MSRIGAFGGTSLASGTESLLNDRRLSGGSAPVAAIASRLRGRSRYPADAWTPYELFADNDVGVWYDFNDFSTMFQDNLCYTPVTAVGQAVGCVVDKARLDSRGVVNLIPNSEVVSDAWTATSTVSYSGNTIIETTANSSHFVYRNSPTAPSVALVVDASPAGRNWLTLVWRSGGSNQIGYFDIANGVLGNIPSGFQASISPVGNGVFRCTMIGSCTAANNALNIGLAVSNGVNSYTGDGVSGITIHRTQFNFGTAPAEYQYTGGNFGNAGISLQQSVVAARPILRQDERTGAHYLEFDGIDDSLATIRVLAYSSASGARDEFSIFIGARKQSDLVQASLFDYGSSPTSQNGGFYIHAPGSTPATNLYQMFTRGSVGPTTNATDVSYAAPHSAVLTMVTKVLTDTLIGRINGVPVLSSSVDQGVFNRNPQAITLGGRTASLKFNGRVYGFITYNRLSSKETIDLAESWMASRVGVSVV